MDENEYELYNKEARDDAEARELEFFEQDTEPHFAEIKDLIKKIKNIANGYDSKDDCQSSYTSE